MKRFVSLVFSVICLAWITVTVNAATTNYNVNLNRNRKITIVLNKGDSVYLNLKRRDRNVSKKNVKRSVTKKGIVKIKNKTLITGIKNGATTIRYKTGRKQVRVKVYVEDKEDIVHGQAIYTPYIVQESVSETQVSVKDTNIKYTKPAEVLNNLIEPTESSSDISSNKPDETVQNDKTVEQSTEPETEVSSPFDISNTPSEIVMKSNTKISMPYSGDIDLDKLNIVSNGKSYTYIGDNTEWAKLQTSNTYYCRSYVESPVEPAIIISMETNNNNLDVCFSNAFGKYDADVEFMYDGKTVYKVHIIATKTISTYTNAVSWVKDVAEKSGANRKTNIYDKVTAFCEYASNNYTPKELSTRIGVWRLSLYLRMLGINDLHYRDPAKGNLEIYTWSFPQNSSESVLVEWKYNGSIYKTTLKGNKA